MVMKNCQWRLAGAAMVIALTLAGVGLLADQPQAQPQMELIAVFRQWWYACQKVPDGAAVDQLARRVAAHPQDAAALFFLSQAYRHRLELTNTQEKDEPVDGKRLIEMVKTSADLGFLPARARYGVILLNTDLVERSGVTPNKAAGLAMLKDALAKGDPDAHLYMGTLLQRGVGGVGRDPTEAERLLRKAIELGAKRAWFVLALLYYEQRNATAALASMREGAEAGDPMAQLSLASWYGSGTNTKVDPEAAFLWMSKAAEGQKYLAAAHARLAEYYARGFGTGPDQRKAYQWFEVAARLGDKRSAMEMADRRLRSVGCDLDVRGAVRILMQLSNARYPPAESRLARLYLEGLLVERDLRRAKDLFNKAATGGDSEARTYLRWLEIAEQDANTTLGPN